jgi:hypothetical protein
VVNGDGWAGTWLHGLALGLRDAAVVREADRESESGLYGNAIDTSVPLSMSWIIFTR